MGVSQCGRSCGLGVILFNNRNAFITLRGGYLCFMEKVVVTGSSGRIGRAIHWILMQQSEVVGLDVSPSSATTLLGDIRSKDTLLKATEGADTIFHCAALHAPHVGISSDRDFYEINVEATRVLCEAAVANGVSKIVFTSTTALYGYANLGIDEAAWINEQTVPKPRTVYHRTKLEAEHVLQEFAGDQLLVRVLRMSRCFPEPAPVMAVYRLHRGVDYRDVAEAHYLAASIQDDLPYDTYVISGSTPFRRSDCSMLYTNAVEKIRFREPDLANEFERRGWLLPNSIDRVYDSSYAKQKLGWQAKHGAFDLLKQYDEGHFETLPPVN